MTQKNLLVLLVAACVLVFTVQTVNAFGEITSVEVEGLEVLDPVIHEPVISLDLAEFAGGRVPVLVRFDATNNGDNIVDVTENVQIVAWISGERADAVESERFDVIEGRTYTRVVNLNIPFDLDEDVDEPRKLELVVESEERGTADEVSIDLTVQRESFLIEILSINMPSEVQAGEPLVIDVVLKNRGRHLAEDTFLKVQIPELGLEALTFYEDLSPTDQSDPDREDSVERRTFIRIPSNALVGLYDLVFEAFNDDSFTRSERRVSIIGAGEDTIVVTPATSKTFSIDQTGTYKLTIVNRGSIVRVYDVVLDAPAGLTVEIGDPVIVVPAGSSRTVEITANANLRDDYTFTAIIQSDGGRVVSEKAFVAHVTEPTEGTGRPAAANTTILLTVILAIIFIVLLVVLIVLLTRKPEKTEELSGESYY